MSEFCQFAATEKGENGAATIISASLDIVASLRLSEIVMFVCCKASICVRSLVGERLAGGGGGGVGVRGSVKGWTHGRGGGGGGAN